MDDNHDSARRPDQASAPETDRLIQVLSLEYRALKDEMFMRTSGRFQFVGLMTTAAAVLLVGIGGATNELGVWIPAVLAVAVFSGGLFYFLVLGTDIIRISSRIAQIETRINGLLPAQPDGQRVLSWELEHQHRPWIARVGMGQFLIRR